MVSVKELAPLFLSCLNSERKKREKDKVVDVVKAFLKNASYMNEQKEYKISSKKKKGSRKRIMYISHLVSTSTK